MYQKEFFIDMSTYNILSSHQIRMNLPQVAVILFLPSLFK